MVDYVYYTFGCILILGVLVGIKRMSKVETARGGNLLSAACAVFMIILELLRPLDAKVLAPMLVIVGASVPAIWAAGRVTMLQMPQAVALLNGLGGLSSALVSVAVLMNRSDADAFNAVSAALALAIGMITLTGSLVAAGKLARMLPQKSVEIKWHTPICAVLALIMLVLCCFAKSVTPVLLLLVSAAFGCAFAIRVGGADMPITISLLNSLSGVAGGIAGIAVGNPVLICMGGIVGASGLLLTQIMCKAMNRKLFAILIGRAAAAPAKPEAAEKTDLKPAPDAVPESPEEPSEITSETPVEEPKPDLREIVANAKNVIIVPGYGMALSQAQHDVKRLTDMFQSRGALVRFAIHPVAGRMPGHMNVLLCEADVPYDMLFEMDDINPDFASCDLAIAVGANDTINPAANTAEGTPIYGMPVLDVANTKCLVICNMDDRPGYAGVPNPLYTDPKTVFMAGDAKDSIKLLLDMLA